MRIAVVTALGAIGDPESLPPLSSGAPPKRAVARRPRPAPSDDRQPAPPAQRAAPDDDSDSDLSSSVRYVVKLGTMRSNASAQGVDLRVVLRNATRTRAKELKDAAVLEPDSPLLAVATRRHVPVVTLDGNVTQLVESRIANSVQVQAHVEFTVRRDQTLRGTLSGGATTSGSGPTFTDDDRRHLEDEAIDGAVQSALRGADQGLMIAAR